MNWSKEKPQEEGYYFYLPNGSEMDEAGVEEGRAEIVKVIENCLQMPNSLNRFDINGFNGQWNGPLMAPPLASFTCLQCGWEGNEDEMYMIPVDDESQGVIMNEKTCPKCRSVAIEPL